MADTDPFGRRKGEDPLASLGWSSERAQPTEPAPEPAADPPPSRRDRAPGGGEDVSAAPPPSGSPASTRPPGGASPPTPPTIASPGIGRAIRLLVIVIVVFVAGLAALGALVGPGIERVDRFARSLTTTVPRTPLVPPSSTRSTPARPARGLGRGSMLRPTAFKGALARLRRRGYSRLSTLRVAPQRVDAMLLTKGGRIRFVQVDPGGSVRALGARTSGLSKLPTASLAGVDASAPRRLTLAAAKRLGRPTSQVDYLVHSRFGGSASWNVYFSGGAAFAADGRGRITRRIS